MTSPRWPIRLWAIQLVPAACLLAFALWRLIGLDDEQTSQKMSLLALAVGVAWLAAALGMLLSRWGRNWLVQRRKEWCLSLVTGVVCLVVADAALTLLGIVPTIEYQRDRSIAYSFGSFTRARLVSKEILVDGKPSIAINSRGFRGPAIKPDKDAGVVRAIVLGGSQVFDYEGGDWAGRTAELLRQRGIGVEFVNAGVPGHTTTDSLGKLLTDLWMLRPDIVLVCQAWNDIKYFYRLAPDSPYRGLAPRRAKGWTVDWRIYPRGVDRLLSVSAIYRNFRWGLARHLYNEEGHDRLDQTGPGTTIEWGAEQYRHNIELIATLAGRIGARAAFCRQAHLATVDGTGDDQAFAEDYGRRMAQLPNARLMEAFATANRAVEEVAQRHGSLVIDMDGAMSGRREYFADGIHFNAEGSAKAAQVTADALEPVARDILQ